MNLLKQPIKIKNIEISNRIIMPPMATSKSEDGYVNQNLQDYYNEKTIGGYIGLVITEHAYISLDGKAKDGQISVSRESDIEGLKEIVDIIHINGSKVIAQINHAGSSTDKKITGSNPFSASPVKNISATGNPNIIPQEMSKVDIKRTIQYFAEAARRVKEAGFDGVEIHSAHGYLLNQFFSPISNKRTDEYGQSLAGRIKIHLEIIAEIRKVVGENYLIALRLGGCDYMEGGSTLNDGLATAKAFEKAGVDLLDISGGFCGYMREDNKNPGYFSELSELIKREVSIPVIVTGGIREGKQAENLLNENKADLIGVGRAILKDSEWAKKVILSNTL